MHSFWSRIKTAIPRSQYHCDTTIAAARCDPSNHRHRGRNDCYLISVDGWGVKTTRILETDKKGKTKDKGWTCDLVPKSLIVARYFTKRQAAIESKQVALEASAATLAPWRLIDSLQKGDPLNPY